jgi:hypothetical protein
MSDAFTDFASYIDPQMAQEAMGKLKAAIPEESREATLASIGSLTHRDLLFYSIGKTTGMAIILTSFQSTFLPSCDYEQKGKTDAKGK